MKYYTSYIILLVLFLAPKIVLSSSICLSPHSITQIENTSTSISIEWSDFSTPSDVIEYNISFTLLGESPDLNDFETSLEKSFTFENLEPASSYEVRLRTVCSNGNTTWSAPIYIYTEIDPSVPCNMNLQIDDNSCGNPMLFNYTVEGLGESLGVNTFIREIKIAIAHNWPSDLECRLISPNGESLLLFQDQGIGSSNVGNISNACDEPLRLDMSACESVETTADGLKGTLRPQGDLADLYINNSNPNGDWYLEICDDANGQVGILRTFEIVFEDVLCEAPESIGISTVTENSIDLVIAASNCDSLEILLTSVVGMDSFIIVVPCDDDTIQVNGLQASTEYEFLFSASCASSDLSSSCSNYFETYCAETGLIETFDNLSKCNISCEPCTTGSLFQNTSNNQWKIGEGSTNTDLTGPRSSLFDFGKYVYIESSEECTDDDYILQSSCLGLLTDTSCNVSFYYHMEGDEISSLFLEISVDNGANWTSIWDKHGSQGNDWFLENITLSIDVSNQFQLRFRATNPSGDLGDIAIDQIRLVGIESISESSQVYYLDADNDGYGSNVDSIIYCGITTPAGYTVLNGDCNDENELINPGISESECNGIDDNCNGLIDEDSDSSLSWVLDDIKDQSCNGVIDGRISLIGQGGIPPYEIEWNTGQESFTIENLEAGMYFATISDAGNCTIQTDTFTIQLLQSFDFLIWSTSNATCLGINDGAIAIAHDEDNGPFTYNWSNGTNEKELDNVGPGNYSVEIIDVNGCSINSGDITIHADRIVEIEFDSISAVSCANFSDGYASIILDSSYASTLWNNGANGLTVDNISGGTYTILVTDSTNCQGIDSIEIAEPAPLNIEIVSNESVSCFGENDGYVEVTVSGGNEGYEFEWSNGSLDNNIDLLTAGFYDVSISDSKSCVDSLIGIEVWEPDSLVVSLLTKGDETCTGQNGFVDIEIEGGTEAYEFMWSNDSTSQNLEELEAGIYSVTVVDRNNCQAFIDDIGINRIEVIIEEEITNVNDVNCFGEKNGSFELNLENVTAYPMILYVNGDSIISENANLILDSLDGGEYSIEGEDANGCLMDMIAVTIDEPQELNILITEINTVSCGELGGEITIQVTGGTEPFDINWSNGQTGETIDSLDVGFYSVEIFDSKMCSDSIIDIEIGTSAPLVQETITINQPLCNGDMTGVIDLIYTGGLGNITYELNGDEFDNGLFETLGAGIYDVVISDSSLCNVDSLSFEIINPPVLTITLDSISPSYCGNTNGYIAVSAIGGTGELNYNWSGGISDTSSIVTNISEGLYDVVVLDENGCGVGLEDLEIENIDKVLDVENLFIDSTSCFNTSNGKIFYDLVGDYSFPIETTLNNEVFAYSNGFINNVPAGNYELVITDVVGCTYEINEVLIESPLPIEYEFEILVPIICLDDSTGVISMNAMGGTGELDYLWDNNDEGQTIDSLASGYYRCAIVDERNCVLFTDSIFLENPDTLIVNLVTIDATEGNNNGAIYVTTSGGVMPYEYNWNYDIPTDTDTIEFLGESSWNLNFVDGNGCMFDTSFVIKNIVGIEEVEFIEVKISPNPFHDYLQIRTELDDKEYSIVILSAQGELVRHIDPSALLDEKIFLGDLMAGIYFVVLKTENGVIVRKLVKR